MKTMLTCLLTCLLASCSFAKSAIKSGEWHFKHKQLMFVVPTANEESHEHLQVTTCDYHQAEWAPRTQKRACIEYTDKNNDEWLLIFSHDRSYPVFVSKNGDVVYLRREEFLLDV